MNIFTKVKNINENRIIDKSSMGLILFINLILISIFAKYYSIKSDLDNPLIPKYMVSLAYEPYIKKGIILSIGFLVLLILKYLKQNVLVIVIALALIWFYFFTNHNIGSWSTQIK